MTEMTNDSMEKHTGIGEVQIANEVVASIAGISASEVEGVDSMAGGWPVSWQANLVQRICPKVSRWKWQTTSQWLNWQLI